MPLFSFCLSSSLNLLVLFVVNCISSIFIFITLITKLQKPEILSDNLRAIWRTFQPQSSKCFPEKNYYIFSWKYTLWKNFLYFFQKEDFLIFWETELSYIFSKKVFLIFREIELSYIFPKILFFYVLENGTFRP